MLSCHLAEELDSTRPAFDAERWTHVFQAMMKRYQKGIRLLPTCAARTGVLRCYDFKPLMQFMLTGNVVCTSASGTRPGTDGSKIAGSRAAEFGFKGCIPL